MTQPGRESALDSPYDGTTCWHGAQKKPRAKARGFA